ncbi:hypothetical protein PIB30_085332 [Stylosanthes scabra]|uniref:Uncharacterized protein n=1 Tax=Stylosanthes scabra TaxID=79078 RepID=A0ABU6QT11_9FABA|nr:hypothetical protein [Stylosanthes scabra]
MNPNGAATRAKTTDAFLSSIHRTPSCKLEELTSRKNINKEETRFLHDESANKDGLKECVASLVRIKRLSKVVPVSYSADDDDNEEKHAQCIEEHKDFQGVERNNSGGEELYEYDKINVKHENNDGDKNDEKDCNKYSICLDCRSLSFKIYCIEIEEEKENNDNHDGKEEEFINEEEEETADEKKLFQQPSAGKTSIIDDESMESASASQSSDANKKSIERRYNDEETDKNDE